MSRAPPLPVTSCGGGDETPGASGPYSSRTATIGSTVTLKKLVERITRPVEDIDREQLGTFCDARHLTPIDEIVAREPVRVGGEVRSVRIVPRAGAAALEVTVTDGRGSVVGVFLGRRKIAGLSPVRR